MRKIQKFVVLFLVFSLVASLAIGCQQQAGDDPDNGEQPVETIELVLSSSAGTGGAEEIACQNFSDYLYEISNGRFKIIPYMGGVLGAAPEVAEMVNLGEVHFLYAGLQEMEQFVGPGQWPFNIPFLFDTSDRDGIQELMQNEIIGFWNESLEKAGINVRVLFAQLRTNRHLVGKEPLTSADQLVGLNMRLPTLAEFVGVFQDILGANAVAVPASEIFSTLQTGMVDAHESTVSFMYSNRFHEITPYITWTNHNILPRVTYVSQKWLETLTEEELGWVNEAVEKAMLEAYDDEFKYEEELKAKSEEEGAVYIYDGIDVASFEKPVAEKAEEHFKHLYPEDIWTRFIQPRIDELKLKYDI